MANTASAPCNPSTVPAAAYSLLALAVELPPATGSAALVQRVTGDTCGQEIIAVSLLKHRSALELRHNAVYIY
eukprot:364201-Chlamydomonas_euryale.AAC.13